MPQPVVIITGASRGLGAAAATSAAKMGARVVLNARSADTLNAVAKSIQQAGGTTLVVPGDISQPDDCRHLVEATVAQWGRIDAIVNNAGIVQPIARIADAEALDWQENWSINLLGPVVLTQAALPYLRQSKGRVIHVSSGAAVKVISGWSAYSVAKAALNHFNRMLAAEEPEITTIALRPGAINTDMHAVIREHGTDAMTTENYNFFFDLFRQDKLLPPEKPGRAVALLALYAPHEWSGEFIQWDEERVTRLAENQ
jgi:NAD(P)-dependent dehydrogenase (short-subunit alcohol dehydrogenase family)